MTDGKLLFVDRSIDLIVELQQRGIDAIHTDDPIAYIEYDWIVSPANCCGYMDGGFDKYLATKLNIDPVAGWRPHIDPSATPDMREPYLEPGEVTKWPEKDILIAPTVLRPVAHTKRPADASHVRECLAKLYDIANEEAVTVACPGLGTGFGGLTNAEFAALAADVMGR